MSAANGQKKNKGRMTPLTLQGMLQLRLKQKRVLWDPLVFRVGSAAFLFAFDSFLSLVPDPHAISSLYGISTREKLYWRIMLVARSAAAGTKK